MLVSAEGIRELVEPALAADGLELWDVEVSPRLIRILVDRPGGVDLDSLASLTSRVLSPLVDERPDLVPAGRYELEVSSPGVERRLRTLDQYRRFVGSEVAVKTSEAVAGARRHQGTLVAVDEQCIRLSPEGTGPDDAIEIPHEHIERARTVLVWGPAPRPGARGQGAPRRAGRARTAAHLKDAG
jgi:ribosome maturation factor RimP